MDATSVGPSGSTTIEHTVRAADPPIDCFYVYPTVSTQSTPNANLAVDPAETSVAIMQASRFSADCRIYSPMYRQATLSAIADGFKGVNENEVYGDVLDAWNYYLAHYNRGRGVVMIGHSQGSFVLENLISNVIDPRPSERKLLVSAILLGGNVNVRKISAAPSAASSTASGSRTAERGGSTFANIPPCRTRDQIGCVVAYSSFDHAPPENSLFGRTSAPGEQVLCVNPVDPSAPIGVPEPLSPYFPTKALGVGLSGGKHVVASTPWVTYPALFTATCEYRNGASWLQIADVRSPGDRRAHLEDQLGPTWGLHLIDVNIALGNLVNLVQSESGTWVASHRG